MSLTEGPAGSGLCGSCLQPERLWISSLEGLGWAKQPGQRDAHLPALPHWEYDEDEALLLLLKKEVVRSAWGGMGDTLGLGPSAEFIVAGQSS